MPHKLMDRESFDACISSIIAQEERNLAEIKRMQEELDRLEKCQAFLRGLMRTHTHLPSDDKPQYFMFSEETGEPALINEFLAPETENLMPKMPRIKREGALMRRMSNGKTGFVVGAYPFNDHSVGHSRFIVDFQTWTAESMPKDDW